MYLKSIKWDIYEIKTKLTPITGVMFRGRVRKFYVEKDRNILVENAMDIEKVVRFAIPSGEDPSDINKYVNKIAPDATIELIRRDIPNPLLSKLKVNIGDRYTL
jgi:hypothetical protein